MKKISLLTAVFSLILLPSMASANDATSAAPPGVTMSSSGGVPAPPVCNAYSQMLRWTGSAWQCIANPGVTSVGKGAVAKVYTNTNGANYCPGGTTRHLSGTSDGGWVNLSTRVVNYHYFCLKN